MPADNGHAWFKDDATADAETATQPTSPCECPTNERGRAALTSADPGSYWTIEK